MLKYTITKKPNTVKRYLLLEIEEDASSDPWIQAEMEIVADALIPVLADQEITLSEMWMTDLLQEIEHELGLLRMGEGDFTK